MHRKWLQTKSEPALFELFASLLKAMATSKSGFTFYQMIRWHANNWLKVLIFKQYILHQDAVSKMFFHTFIILSFRTELSLQSVNPKCFQSTQRPASLEVTQSYHPLIYFNPDISSVLFYPHLPPLFQLCQSMEEISWRFRCQNRTSPAAPSLPRPASRCRPHIHPAQRPPCPPPYHPPARSPSQWRSNPPGKIWWGLFS